jgi:hypothetical protein
VVARLLYGKSNIGHWSALRIDHSDLGLGLPVLFDGRRGFGQDFPLSGFGGFRLFLEAGKGRIGCPGGRNDCDAGEIEVSVFAVRSRRLSLPLWTHFFLLVFFTIRAFSIFFRKWANFVAGLRAVCRPFPVISVILSRAYPCSAR